MEHTQAFYTSRVDDDGNEIEIRQTARTYELPPRSTRSNVSSRQSSRSVQYVNPAVYIEKNTEDARSKRSASAISIPSASDIVPPLDLQSEECYPSRREGYTFSYRNNGEPAKLDANPELAYENWLSAKRKILSNEAARRKQEQAAKLREKEERKRLSDEKYQKWLESKTKTKAKPEEKSVEKKTTNDQLTIVKLEEWERSKRLEQDRRREMKRREVECREREEEKRRQLAQDAWEKWIAEAANKPKPVPLNRGIFTLRGTVSDIFVNPNEWKSGDGL